MTVKRSDSFLGACQLLDVMGVRLEMDQVTFGDRIWLDVTGMRLCVARFGSMSLRFGYVGCLVSLIRHDFELSWCQANCSHCLIYYFFPTEIDWLLAKVSIMPGSRQVNPAFTFKWTQSDHLLASVDLSRPPKTPTFTNRSRSLGAIQTATMKFDHDTAQKQTQMNRRKKMLKLLQKSLIPLQNCFPPVSMPHNQSRLVLIQQKQSQPVSAQLKQSQVYLNLSLTRLSCRIPFLAI